MNRYSIRENEQQFPSVQFVCLFIYVKSTLSGNKLQSIRSSLVQKKNRESKERVEKEMIELTVYFKTKNRAF